MSNTTPPPPGFPPPLPAEPPAPKRNRTNALIIGSAVAVIAAIVATGVVVANSRDDGASTDSSAPAAESTEPADGTITADLDPEPSPSDTEPEIMGLTDGVAYEDGVEVTLSGYKRGVSSEWASPGSAPYVAFTVKIDNKSDVVVDIGTGYVMCYYGDESREAEQVFDSERGLDGVPSLRLRPGRTAQAKVACELPKGEEYLQVELAPSMESETAIFAGNVK